ncbi:MAG: hypothetical protein K9I84_03645 [Leadbetterella sp.]|nr:hypothetical protein [Leadbetterella sp.]
MKFNPLTKEVYTDQDEFIKKMDCPLEMNWANLTIGNGPQTINCASKFNTIMPTGKVPVVFAKPIKLTKNDT